MDWHSLSEKEVIDKLDSSYDGLSEAQVLERLNSYGENKLKKTSHFNALKILFEQFKSFLIIILILAAILSFFMESKIDAIVILGIILINSALGFFQEYKAEKAIEELKKMIVPLARVIRNGKIVEINSSKLVPGDILILNEGDKIMADARILSSNGLRVNEATLTGESVPELKISKKISSNLSLADRINMVYQGTIIVGGSAKAIVINTGIGTELGRISELVQNIQPEQNPFKEKLDHFAKSIGVFIICLSIFIAFLLYFRNTSLFQSFLVSISLAVSAIPEGLPAVITLALAFATRRMIKKNILIRKLPASETLGRTTVICTDKTGTLTEEKMKVSHIYVNNMNHMGDRNLLLKIGVLCNKARHEKEEEKDYFVGDPTEVALIISAKNNFLDKKKLTEQEPKIKEFPFNSERKMMSVVRKYNGKIISYVKGAPEKIIERCDYELIDGRRIRLNKDGRADLFKRYELMAKKGLRVLGFAYKEMNEKSNLDEEEVESGLVFVGFQGMIDPPRQEVKGAIALCNDAGIRVLMITGDSKLTASAVAEEIGLKGKVIDASELNGMSDERLADTIRSVSVFSRVSPQDKLRIVNILKKKGEVVAVTGDGVNDALALKRADIGVAMGIRGTDVARDSSDIVLLDDNFASIVEGVSEGRRVYSNIKKFVKFLLASNFYEVFLVAIMVGFGFPLPLLPLQILWINLVTDSFPALALSSEKLEQNVMKRKPNREGILSRIKGFIFFAGLVGLILTIFIFIINLNNLDKARTMTLTLSVIYQMFLVFNCKSEGSVFKSGFNKYIFYAVGTSIILHIALIYSSLGKLFYVVPLGFYDWLVILALALGGFFFVEGFKLFLSKNNCYN